QPGGWRPGSAFGGHAGAPHGRRGQAGGHPGGGQAVRGTSGARAHAKLEAWLSASVRALRAALPASDGISAGADVSITGLTGWSAGSAWGSSLVTSATLRGPQEHKAHPLISSSPTSLLACFSSPSKATLSISHHKLVLVVLGS